MDINKDNYTDLVLAHGAVQVSPSELRQLNQLPMTTHQDERFNQPMTLTGYAVLLTGYASHIRESEKRNIEYAALLTELTKLRAMPRPQQGHRLTGSIDTYSMTNKDYRIDYRVYSGQIIVFNIQPTTSLQRHRDRQEQTSIYKIKKDKQGAWKVSHKIKKITTQYAAVNGQSNNLIKATWLMGSHLEYEFGSSVNEYSLFHNPSVGGPGDTWESVQDKFGFTTEVTKAFAKVLENTQQQGNQTDWLVHSQGGVIFSEGVRYLLNGHSSSALRHLKFNGLRHPKKGTLLDKQRLALHGNANNNARSSLLFKRAGIEVVATRAHDYDFVSNILGNNTVNPRKLLGSIIYANHVIGGSIGQSPHTTMQSMEDWQYNMAHGPGQGRNRLQAAFHGSGKTITNTKDRVKALTNYLP